MTVSILVGDCRSVLVTLPDRSVQCCVTSPPYFGLRDYGHDGQIGLEQTPDAYVAELVAVFREVRRVLRDDGTCWLNLGDSYAGHNARGFRPGNETKNEGASNKNGCGYIDGLKPKDLIGIPWMVAFALRADGWYLRQDIIWHKPNPMPESVTDRCTKGHEYIFLLSKSARYYFDAKAIAEPASEWSQKALAGNWTRKTEYGTSEVSGRNAAGVNYADRVNEDGTRNRRSVWSIASQPFSGAHFATMPPELATDCIKAGSKIGDMILDPFGGAGTTALAADRLQRDATIIELNPAYAQIARDRINGEAGLFSPVAAE